MKILVCIKHVPDTETKVSVNASGNALDESAVTKWVISPYDEYALEQALQFRDAVGGEVVLACAGREAATATLRQGLAMGADRAVLVQDERYDSIDALARAEALAAVVREEGSELVLAGKYGVGTDENLTGPMLAELLDWPHIAAVSKLELNDGAVSAERAVEGAVEIVEGQLPVLITCDKGLNEPRYPSLKGIMQAKRKPIVVKQPDELGLAPGGPRVVWNSMALPPERQAGRILDGSPAEAAVELARLLQEEAKVI